MSKPKPIQINIPNSCQQPWNEMRPSGNGRHCAHCDKVVTDFTKFTDKQLFEHFSQNIHRPSCGRFTTLQVNRPILPPPQPHSKLYRLFIGLGLTLLLTQIPTHDASSKTPFVSCYDKFVVNENEQEVTGDDSVHFAGTVIYGAKPIAGAMVHILREKEVIASTSSDSNGAYTITVAGPKTDLTIHATHQLSQTTIIHVHAFTITSNLEIVLFDDSNFYKGRVNLDHSGKKGH